MVQWKKNLYICWLTQVLSLTGFGFMLPFIPLYIQQLGVSGSEELRIWVGILTAVPSLTVAVMAPVWGFISDRVGRKIMIVRAMVAGVLVVGFMALAGNVYTVLILRILQGMLTGTVTASATLVAAGTPRRHLASALGILSSSTFVGFSFGPFVGGLSAEVLGFRLTFLVGSGVIFVGLLLVLLFVREHQVEEREGPQERPRLDLRVLVQRGYGILFLLILMERFSRMMPQTFIPLYIQELLGSARGVAGITGVISAAAGAVTALSALTLARLGDRHDRDRLLLILLGAAALTAFPIFLRQQLGWFSLFYLVSIYFLGAVAPLLLSQLSALTPPGKRGAVLGLQTSAGNIGWFFSPLAGSAVAIWLDLRHVFLLYCISLAATLVVVFLKKRSQRAAAPASRGRSRQ